MNAILDHFYAHPFSTGLLGLAVLTMVATFFLGRAILNRLMFGLSFLLLALAFAMILIENAPSNLPFAVVAVLQAFMAGVHFEEYRGLRRVGERV